MIASIATREFLTRTIDQALSCLDSDDGAHVRIIRNLEIARNIINKPEESPCS